MGLSIPLFTHRALLLASAVLLAAGCAARKAPPPSAPLPAPAPSENTLSPESEGTSRDRLIEESVASAREEYRQGVEALRQGQRESARLRFDKAIDILLDAPVSVASDQRLGETFSELVENIHAMELEAVQTGSGLDYEETPAEELGKIEPSITPEKAERERALAEETRTTYDLPMVLNTKVLAWIDIYTGPMRDRFEEGLRRSGWYLPMIQRIFREEGLPQDMAYIAHVESSYKPYAYSRARAKGVWQFIVDTARRYGLRRDWWVDERSDPEMATRAAAAYLKELHEMFGDWYLAMAAYNAGEAKIQRAMDRTGLKDFWSLSSTSQLRLETKNYVPAILAAIVISKSQEKFGFKVQKEPPVVYDRVSLDQPVDLRVAAKCAGTSLDELKRLNPALYRLQTPPNYPGYELRLPQGSGQAFQIVYSSLSPSQRLLAQQHTVQKGETLAAIANRYGIGVSSLASANNLGKRSALKAGMVISVPTSLAPLTGLHPDRPGESGYRSRRRRGRTEAIHRVARGETLYSIAKRYGTTVEALREANGLGSRETITPGKRLVVRSASKPAGGSPSRATASPAKTTPKGSDGKSRLTYRVRKGDTLARIASAHGSTIEELCRWNAISQSSPLQVGSTLVLYR